MIKLIKQIISLILAVILTLEPVIVAADIVADGSTNTTVEEIAGQDTSLVNIANPNAKGDSFNNFSDYNPVNDTVINNATNYSDTSLVGIVAPNSHLSSSADRIFAEVTGSDKSELRYRTEIAGKKAEFILINPNGIICDGCGFINTSRNVLSAGKMSFDEAGNIKLLVRDGKVEIGQGGLYSEADSYNDIITRSLLLNGAINGGKEINLYLGASEFDYATKTSRAIDGTRIKPEFALDSSALGGMYAGRIRLIGTETGLGVNINGKIHASESLYIANDGKIKVKGDIVAGKSDITASEVDNEGRIVTASSKIKAEKIVNRGLISSDADNIIDARVVDNQNTSKEAKTGIVAASKLQINAYQLFNQDGYLATFGLVSNKKSIPSGPYVGSNIVISLGSSYTNNGILESAGLIDITATSIVNQNQLLSGGAVNLTATSGDVTNDTGAIIDSNNVNFNATGSVINKGAVYAATNGTVISQNFLNDKGFIEALGNLSFNVTDSFTNRNGGWIYGGTGLDIKADKVYNLSNSVLFARNGPLSITDASGNRNSLIYNISSRILTENGDGTLKTTSLINNPDSTTFFLNLEKFNALATGGLTDDKIQEFIALGALHNPLKDKEGSKEKLHYFVVQPQEGVKPSEISFGGNLYTDIGTLDNTGSIFEATGNIALNADKVINNSFEAKGVIYLYQYLDFRGGLHDKWFNSITDANDFATNEALQRFLALQTNPELDPKSIITPGIIRAGGNVIANIGAGGYQGITYQTGASIGKEAIPALAHDPYVNDGNIYSFKDDLASGAYDYNATGPYLYTTKRKALTIDDYIDLSYVTTNMGTNPYRFIGDGLYVTELAIAGIKRYTHEKYLSQSIGSDADQIKALYDDAYIEMGRLQLTPYIALSAEQVAALQKDIVWFEPQLIGTEIVLVPKLYLSQNTLSNQKNNSSKIIAGGAINTTSTGDITTSRGGFEAGSTIDLRSTTGNVILTGSNIDAGGKVTIKADTGSVLLNNKLTQYGSGSNLDTYMQARTQINAGGDIDYIAGNTFIAQGIKSHSDGQTTVNADEIYINGQKLENNYEQSYGKKLHIKTSDTENIRSEFSASTGHNITLTGGSYLNISGSTVTADHITGTADNIDIAPEIEQHYSYKKEKSKNGLNTKKSEETHDHITADKAEFNGITHLTATNTLNSQSAIYNGVTTLDGAQVNLDSTTESHTDMVSKSGNNKAWQHAHDQGTISTSETLNEFHDTVTINSAAAVNVEIGVKEGETLEQAVARISQTPGYEYLNTLKNDPSINWSKVQEQYQHWDYKSQGLTQEAAVAITIAVAIATGGMGAGISGATGVVTTHVSNVVFSTLVSKATTSVINNRGNIGAVLNELGSSDTVKELTINLLVPTPPGVGNGVIDTAINVAAYSAEKSFYQTVIYQTNFTENFIDNLKYGTVSVIAKEVANDIGEDYGSKFKGEYDAEDITNSIIHKVEHGALGCAFASATGGSCAGGATSAIIAETMAEIYTMPEMIKLRKDYQQGKISKEEFTKSVSKFASDGANIGKFSALGAAFLIGEDEKGISAATNASNNAIDNNFLPLITAIIAVTTYTGYVGEGDLADGLKLIGQGDDPLSKAIENGVENTVELSYELYPQQTEAALSVLSEIGELTDTVITYIDDKTGNTVSKKWNELDLATQNKIKGGGKLFSVVFSSTQLSKLAMLKKVDGNVNLPNSKPDFYVDSKGRVLSSDIQDAINKPVHDDRLEYSYQFLDDLKNFDEGNKEFFSGKLDKDLYVVNFHDSSKNLGEGRSVKWWTTTDQINNLSTLDEVHNFLALPYNWGKRDSVSIAKIPYGSNITYFKGLAEKQRGTDGQWFDGGAEQIRFRDFDEKWILDTKQIK